MLTRKSYIQIAKIIKNAENLEQLISGLIGFMCDNNPNFDRTKFLQAIK